MFTRQVNFKKTIIGGKCQNSKIQMRHFESFSNKVLDSKFLFSYFREHIRTPWKTTLNSFSCWPPEDFLILVLHLLLDWSTSPEELLLPKATTLVLYFEHFEFKLIKQAQQFTHLTEPYLVKVVLISSGCRFSENSQKWQNAEKLVKLYLHFS